MRNKKDIFATEIGVMEDSFLDPLKYKGATPEEKLAFIGREYSLTDQDFIWIVENVFAHKLNLKRLNGILNNFFGTSGLIYLTFIN
jgi:hypothetical protein